jgi:pimeloyl-ACP methyl ester carboxylesterase
MGMRIGARTAALLVTAAALCAASAPAAQAKTTLGTVEWVPGYAAPGTPEKLDKVGLVKVGSPTAKNVLVMEPGTSGGGAYFIPLAVALTEKSPEWQVWAVERRENLLEKQSELTKYKEGKVSGEELFNYYLGYLTNPAVTKHYKPLSERTAVKDGADEWGLNTAVQDLHIVIEKAKALGGKVVLGGHSLGGQVITAYATWDFGGHPGAEGLSGLVFDDGASSPTPISAGEAEAGLNSLKSGSPWLAFGGIPSPDLGLFSMLGSSLSYKEPTAVSPLASFGLLPPELKAKNAKGEAVTPDNEAAFGYDVNVGTSPPNLAAAQAHVGAGLQEPSEAGKPWTWNGAGAITPLPRYSEMLAGGTEKNADGSEWYFPERLTLDEGAVANGIPNPAQAVLGVHAIYGESLPKSLHMLAINSELDKLFGGSFTTLNFVEDLAAQSGIPSSNLTLINEEDTYAHNDPNGAYPANALLEHLVPFLAEL